jgi:hypothetical protein
VSVDDVLFEVCLPVTLLGAVWALEPGLLPALPPRVGVEVPLVFEAPTARAEEGRARTTWGQQTSTWG